MRDRLAGYYALCKPGIVRGNAVHVLVGALVASTGALNIEMILWVVLGTSMVIASACIANNYIDKDIDAKMTRTKKRPSVTGAIPVSEGYVLLGMLLAAGLVVLGIKTNWIVLSLGVAAYVMYVAAYGWAKRHTLHSTLIGAVPGALPALAGFVAVNGALSLDGWLVFVLILLWQMPHFYAISIFRRSEYKAAELPVLGAVRSFVVVRRYILAYMVLYVAAIAVMTAVGTFSPVAGIVMLIGAIYWLYVFHKVSASDQERWARAIFGTSLLLTLLLLAVSLLDALVIA